MIIKRFWLPTREQERRFILSGGTTLGMPQNTRSIMPFGIFPHKEIHIIDFGDVTVFAGSSNSPMELLVHIIISKLMYPSLPDGINRRLLEEYVNYCGVVTIDGIRLENIKSAYISKEQAADFVRQSYPDIDKIKKWSILRFYEKAIPTDSFVIIEAPENVMSFEELREFAEFIYMAAYNSGCQFLIISNSPVMLGIRNAIIYDFNDNPVIPNTWYYSKLAAEHAEFYRELSEAHKRGRAPLPKNTRKKTNKRR